MARRKRTPRTRLSPAERHKRSREAQIDRVMSLVIEGCSLATISRREHMPRYRTLQRWRETDGAFRARFAGALWFQQHVMADDALAIADRAAAAQRGRARAKAVKLQIATRNWWSEFHRKEALRKPPATDDPQSELLARLQRAVERIRKDDPEGAERLARRLNNSYAVHA